MGRKELPDSVFELAGQLVIDAESARHETGDVINPVRRALLKVDNIFTLGQLITGRRSIDVGATTVFKSVGMALYDLYFAESLLQAARGRNGGPETSI